MELKNVHRLEKHKLKIFMNLKKMKNLIFFLNFRELKNLIFLNLIKKDENFEKVYKAENCLRTGKKFKNLTETNETEEKNHKYIKSS